MRCSKIQRRLLILALHLSPRSRVDIRHGCFSPHTSAFRTPVLKRWPKATASNRGMICGKSWRWPQPSRESGTPTGSSVDGIETTEGTAKQASTLSRARLSRRGAGYLLRFAVRLIRVSRKRSKDEQGVELHGFGYRRFRVMIR